MAVVLCLALPLKGMLFFFLLLLFRLRARSAFLASLSLTNYSEFGLIVASVVLPEWMVPLALTVALSFVISAPLNRIAHPLYEALADRLSPFERDLRHPDEQPISLHDASAVRRAERGRPGLGPIQDAGAPRKRPTRFLCRCRRSRILGAPGNAGDQGGHTGDE